MEYIRHTSGGKGGLKVFAAILFFASPVATTANAQAVTASLVGRVADIDAHPVGGATLILKDSLGFSRTIQTTGDGQYTFPLIPPGTYVLHVQANGFATEDISGIAVEVNSTTRRDLSLRVAGDRQAIAVNADDVTLETDRADLAQDFSSRQVADLPLFGNMNFETIQDLVPGVTRAQFLNTVFTNAQSTLSNYVNGQSKLANNLEIEGITDNARVGEVQLYIPPAEAIQTVNVNTGNYAPEFGYAGGYVTNVILKSGSNAFHGSAYEYNRVTALTAFNFFNTALAKTPIVYNYYGGTLSGPILHNRLFFFADYLRTDDHEGLFNTFTVPTAEYRSGDLTASTSAIYDPTTGNQTTGAGRTQFSYQGVKNVIPPSRISPLAQTLLALLPLPNSGTAGQLTNNYQSITANNKDYFNYDVKLDLNLRSTDRLSYRYSDEHIATYVQPAFGMAGGPASGGSEGDGTAKIYTTAINYVRTVLPRLVGEFRVGALHWEDAIALADGGRNLASQVGINGVNINGITGLPTIDLDSTYNSVELGFNKNFPSNRAETNFEIATDWISVIGRHTLKSGFEYTHIDDQLIAGGSYPPRGIFQFRQGQTGIPGEKTTQGNDFASFLLDQPSLVGRTYSVQNATWLQNYYVAYAQDNYQIMPDLTLNYGLRWDVYPPPIPATSGGYDQYDPNSNTLSFGGIAPGYAANLNVVTRYGNLAPRIGIAYRPTNSTVVRAAYGHSYYPLIGDAYAYYNYPYTQDASYTSSVSSSYFASPVTMATGFPMPAPATIPPNGTLTNPIASQAYVTNTKQKIPYVEMWNLTVEQALPGHFVWDISYVGNNGIDTLAATNLNASTTPGAGASGQPEFAAFRRTAATTLIDAYTTPHYNALQTKLVRSFHNGLAVTASYTWDHALSYKSDTTALAGFPQYIKPRSNYGRSIFDRPQTAVQSVVYELPLGLGKPFLNSGLTARLLGGWQVTAIISEMSGLPLQLTASATSLNAPGNTQFVNVVGAFKRLKRIGAGNQWFDRNAFLQPTTAALGTGRYTMFTGPGFFDTDAALFKTFDLERYRLEFRAEAFGLTNTPQFSNPDGFVSDATFGQVTAAQGATGSRVVQLSGKVSF